MVTTPTVKMKSLRCQQFSEAAKDTKKASIKAKSQP